MATELTAFERYHSSQNGKTTLLRLLLGTVVIVLVWTLSTFAMVRIGWGVVALVPASLRPDGYGMEAFLTSPIGVLTALLTFCGIWAGAWLVMRWIHREPLSTLFGNSHRISRSDLLKGFAAVILTSIFSEVLLYLIDPVIQRGSIGFAAWLLALVPVALLGFVQTSSEELLFRGYLPRGLARRFRSPLVWALLPTLVFTTLHWSGSSAPAMNAAGLISIGAFAVVLMMLVYSTGNLGAAFGAHLGNNLFGFLLISHQANLSSFALFEARSLEGAGWAGIDVILIAGIGIASSLLTALLLLHRRSPLRVVPDRG
ncbi:CPBP family intramembrane metalloprotease domain-containing protein [Mesorhizobium loti]|nr:type II CAAX endopeptidase family protein [Mesorhizobium loti]PLP56821.1 CPBP family intramembrane metalloprotease domain-containing protein [Mesorhizobium loti]